MKLSTFANNRDNNFNLLRVIAACAVLFSHSFALVTGVGDGEPLRKLAPELNMIFGSIAVDVFFIISGFLVTGSLLSRKSLSAFFKSRALRIYPALIVSVLLMVIVLGLFFSTLPPSSFFSHSRAYTFLIKNSVAVLSGIGTLPGVFETNPFSKAVNGSLWTIKYEVRLYLAIGLLWYLVKGRRDEAFKYLIVSIAAALIAGHILTYLLTGSAVNGLRFSSLFFTGAACHALKDRIVLSSWAFIASLLAVLASATNPDIFFASYHLLLPYIVFFLAYVPSGPIRLFNNAGDYSYGIYIYAFPIQQSLVAAIPGISVPAMVIYSFCITFSFAFLSWHLIEDRALKFKKHKSQFAMGVNGGRS